jgi:hypothetical protein
MQQEADHRQQVLLVVVKVLQVVELPHNFLMGLHGPEDLVELPVDKMLLELVLKLLLYM